MDVCVFVAVHVRVLPVQRQHLQVPDVRLSPSGGKTDFYQPRQVENIQRT